MDYASLLSLVQARRSIRRFTDRPVARDDLLRLLEAARWAPSNHNRQPWRFLVITDPERIGTLARDVGERLAAKLRSLPAVAAAWTDDLARHAVVFGQAPVLIVALHKQPIGVAGMLLDGLTAPGLVSGEPLSVAMAVQNLVLAAHTLGLGTCVLTAPLMVPDALRTALPVPPGFHMTCLVALGYPAETPEPPRRKNLEHIAEFMQHPIAPPEETQ